MPDFSGTPRSINEVFELIQQSSFGNKIMEEFHRLNLQKTIQIKNYPEEIRVRLLAVSASKSPLGALFVTDGDEGTIYFDQQGELGIVASFLFHEITHCLDPSLWAGAKKTLSRLEKRDLVFNSECKAFHAQNCLQEELKEIYPSLRAFHLNAYPHISFLNRALTPSEIATMYQGLP